MSPMAQSTAETRSTPALQTTHILFVDDEENILRSLRRLFHKMDGWTCHFANSPAEAVEILSQQPIAVVVSDHKMPMMLGAEFLSRVKEKRPATVRMMLTGQANLQDVERAVNSGEIFRFILKPWRDEDLIDAVRSAVTFYRLRKENERLQLQTESQNEELRNLNKSLEEKVAERTGQLQDALHTARSLNEELRRAIYQTMRSMFSFIEMARPSIGSHSRRVADLAVQLGRKLNYTERELLELELAALLHDIGKLGIPAYLAEKDQSDMRDEERRVYELHAHEGAERLKALEPLANISRIIENHHERYNGTGFPNKTRGGKIPMRSLIIGICDFYDNLNERPHTDLEYHAHLTFQRISDTRENEFPDRLVTLMAELIEQQQRSKLNQDAIRVGLRDLAPKMRLARNIYTVTGSLLAAQGTELTAKAISRIRAVAQVDRIAGEVYVLPRKSRDESTASPINHSD